MARTSVSKIAKSGKRVDVESVTVKSELKSGVLPIVSNEKVVIPQEEKKIESLKEQVIEPVSKKSVEPPTVSEIEELGKKTVTVEEIEGKNKTDLELMRCSGKSPFSTFLAFPKKVKYISQLDEEEIILIVRAHWINNVSWFLMTLLLGILPVVFSPLLSFFSIPPNYYGFGLIAVVSWYAAVFGYALLQFLHWFFNVGLITTERVIDIDWHGIAVNDTSLALIGAVQDVRAAPKGVIQGLFDYGDVFVQTAGTDINVEFLKVPHPRLVSKKIEELMYLQQEEMESK